MIQQRLWTLLSILPLCFAAPAPVNSRRDVNVGWPYGTEKIRGVNIGGVSDFPACLPRLMVSSVACFGAMDHGELVQRCRRDRVTETHIRSQASSMPRTTTPLSTSGHSGSSRTTTPLNQPCNNIGTLGTPRMISVQSQLPVSTMSESPSDTGRTISRTASHTCRVRQNTWTKRSDGQRHTA